MKILIVSDTHGKCERLEEALEREKPINALIHSGDVERDEDYISVIAECPTYIVAGNNDFFSDLPREIEGEICGCRFFVTHGHYYGVSMDLTRVWEEGHIRNADVVVFGHTHRPVIKEMHGTMLINPGSLAYPRQAGRRPTYVTMEKKKDGTWDFQIHEL